MFILKCKVSLYIHYLPIKTGHRQKDNSETKTPIMKYALEIIKETRFQFSILGYVSGKSGYNVKIRELLKFCGIDRPCACYNEEKGTNEYKPLWELGSSKLARKTNVDLMNKVQIDKYAAGLHKEGSTAVNHYTYIEMHDRFRLMCMAFDQPEYYVNEQLEVVR